MQARQQVEGCPFEREWNLANKDPLPDTVSAVNRLPEALREVVTKALQIEYKREFIAAMGLLGDAGPDSFERKPSAVAHAAKLMVFSTVSYLAFMPWHVMSPASMPSVVESFSEGIDAEKLRGIFANSGAVNLFVAARESDDRDSYIRACKSLLSHVKAAYLVLDSEICSFTPESDFAAVCASLGREGGSIGVSDRDKCVGNSYMSARGLKAVYVDTAGKPLIKSSSAIAGETEEMIAHSVPPSTTSESRIDRLKARQASARRPTA